MAAGKAGLLRRTDSVLVVVLSVLVVTPFGGLYMSSWYLASVVGASAVAWAVCTWLAPRRPLVASLAVGIALFALYLAFVVFRAGIPSVADLGEVWDGVTGGWSQLLTASLPAVARGHLLVVPVLLAWLATFSGTELALRTRLAAAPVLPAVAVLVVALCFAGKRPSASLELAAAVVTMVLAVVLIRTGESRSARRAVFEMHAGSDSGVADGRRRSGVPLRLLVVPTVAAVAVGVAAVIGAEPVESRFDLHDHYGPPIEIYDAVSPLAQVRAALTDPSTVPLFGVRIDGVPAGWKIDRIRTAVLDQYDGAVWSTSATFASAGRELPPGPKATVATASVRQQYELNGYLSPFVPQLDRPRRLNGGGMGFDRASGVLVRRDPVTGRIRYTVDSEVSQFRDADLRRATAGNDPTVSRLSLSPPDGWPQPIRDYAETVTAGAGSGSYAVARAIEEELRSTRFGYNAEARPGHSLAVIADFLTAPVLQSDVRTARVGSSEQFAAAFAVLARVKGIPSRVLVGYRVDPELIARGERIDVLPRAIHAWAEVHLNGVGWVPFDPTDTTPRESQPPPPLAPPLTVTTTTPPTTGPPVLQPVQTSSTAPVTPPAPGAGTGSSRSGRALWMIPLALFLPASILGAKQLRRYHRRYAGGAAERAMGAWAEARDHLRVQGVAAAVDRSLTALELASVSVDVVGADAADRVAHFRPIVDQVLYAPEEPDDGLVAAAWKAEEELAGTLRLHSTAPRRLRSALDPRPLAPARRRASPTAKEVSAGR